jgi:CRISPR system Cascade subunit CasC
MFIELHMIQNFSPSNLNRDDLNNPKECQFGNVRRARISSQCIKRAIRHHPLFKEVTGADISERTKWLTFLLRQPLIASGKLEAEADAVAIAFATTYIKQMDVKDKSKAKVLVDMSQDELQDAVAALRDRWAEITPSAKDAEKVLGKIVDDLITKYEKSTSAPDIALFGRMLADQPRTKIDAACQVAHAISTHEVKQEMDFFTAVDTLVESGVLPPEDTLGAGMMGYTGFNSACFYRYARLDWEQLVKNLKGNTDLVRRTVEGFLRASVAALPTGKQNSFAANNPPSFLLAVIWEKGMGWSLSNAFEKPVHKPHEGGLVAPSVAALDKYWGRLCQVYSEKGQAQVAALLLDDGLTLSNLAKHQVKTLDEWITTVMKPAQ